MGSLGLGFPQIKSQQIQPQAGLCPYTQRVVSFPAVPTLGRLCSLITVVPPQPNSPYTTQTVVKNQ